MMRCFLLQALECFLDRMSQCILCSRKVVGGAEKGGIIVRSGPGLTDELAKARPTFHAVDGLGSYSDVFDSENAAFSLGKSKDQEKL